ncbi:hypothetical protein, partial [Nonomuraea sp. KM90]|uniref:hypothetical protein n=1 Tax=Nonomuraea sp. KM90 TaxID=3457428 RepID=UPI003FCCE024
EVVPAPGAAEVTVRSRARDRLVLEMPPGGGPQAMIAVAAEVAGHAASPGTDGAPRLGAQDAATLARLRGLITAIAQTHAAPNHRRSLASALNGEPPQPGSLASALNGETTPSRPAASALNGEPPQPGSLASALNGETTPSRPAASALNGGGGATPTLASMLRAEVERAGLADGQPGPAARLVALARAGELAPEHVAALRGPAALPEIAAAKAVERGAALMGARVRTYGPGLLDIEVPGHPPIPVDIRPTPTGPVADQGVLTYQVDARRTIGANERAAAAEAAAAVARVRGVAVEEHRRLAELHEAVRQVRSATAAQRPGRLGVLHDLATAAPAGLVPAPLAADLAKLLDGSRPGTRHAYWDRMRALSGGTGLLPPEEECRCPEDGPCGCGLRARSRTVRA